ISGIIGGDRHGAGPQIQPGEVQTELSNRRIAILRAIVHKGTQIFPALRKAVGHAVGSNQLAQTEQLAVLPTFRIKLINVDDDVRVRSNADGTRAGQPGEGAVGGQNRDDVRVGAHVSSLVIGEISQAAPGAVSVAKWNEIVIDQSVSPERHASAWTEGQQTRFSGRGRVGEFSRKRIVVENHVAFQNIAQAVKVRAELCRRLAGESVHNGGGVGESRHAVNGDAERIASNHDVGLGRAVQINHCRTALRESAKDVAFVRVVDAVAVGSDDGIGNVPSDFDKSIAQLSSAVEHGKVRAGHAIGQNAPEISGNAVVKTFGIESIAVDDDVEFGAGIGGACRDSDDAWLRVYRIAARSVSMSISCNGDGRSGN